jgi:hypothetical protein
MMNRRSEVLAAMDDVLLAITDGKPIMEGPALKALRSLPPWRAVGMARVAQLAGAVTQEFVDALVAEAREVGGEAYSLDRP